jgi:Co/Zn/Cd efflux system component
MDPIMGIVGAAVITKWSYGLLKDTSAILLDQSISGPRKQKIQEAIEANSDNRVADMHIWKVGAAHYAAIISLVSHYSKPPDHYKNLLGGFKELSHVTVEVNQCNEKPCLH